MEAVNWSKDVVLRAQVLWSQQESAAVIGRAIGKSRNAVLGFAHRHPDMFPPRGRRQAKVVVRASPERRVVLKRAAPKPVQVARPRPARSGEPTAALFETDGYVEQTGADFRPSKPVAFLAVTNSQCKWPLWPMAENPGAAGLCCGEPRAENSAWCRHHRHVARAG